MRVKVVGIATDHARRLSSRISETLGVERLDAYYKVFPDGESYVRIEGGVEDSTVVLVADCSPPRQNHCLVEALLATDSLYSLGAREVVVYAPYLPYARQDRAFLRGEAVSSRAVLRALYSAGVRRLAAVEIHSERVREYFPGELANIKPLPYMAKTAGLTESSVILAPDAGAVRRASEVASAVGAQLVALSKKRDRVTGEITIEAPPSADFSGRDVYIVDDMVSTGSTIAEASRLALEKGARSVSVLVAHFLNLPGSAERLREAGVSRVIASNTIAPLEGGFVEYIDITELVAEALRGCLG